MLKTTSIAAMAMLAIACGRDEPRLVVRVGGATFTRVAVSGTTLRIATIPFEIRNEGGATALVDACDYRVSATVQQRINDQWEQYSGGICPANLMSTPVALRENARQAGDLGVGEAGRFRIRVFYAADASANRSMSAASDAFDVH